MDNGIRKWGVLTQKKNHLKLSGNSSSREAVLLRNPININNILVIEFCIIQMLDALIPISNNYFINTVKPH